MKRTIPLLFVAFSLLLFGLMSFSAEPTLANGANIPDYYIIKVDKDLPVQAAAQALANYAAKAVAEVAAQPGS